MAASEKAESPTLPFASRQDALDYAHQCVQDANHWLAVNNWNIAENYRKAQIQLVFQLCIGSSPCKYDLSFLAIPDQIMNHVSGFEALTHKGPTDFEVDGRDDRVLIPVTYFIESPEGIIPSFVWLEGRKERRDILRQILAPSIDAVLKAYSIISEGEVCMSKGLAKLSHGESVAEFIQGRPKVVNRIDDDVIESFRNGGDQLKLVQDMIGRLRVWLDNRNAWFTFVENPNLGIEVRNMMLCSNEAAS